MSRSDYESKYYDNTKKQLSYTPDLTSNVTSGLGSAQSSRATDYGYNRLDGSYRKQGENKRRWRITAPSGARKKINGKSSNLWSVRKKGNAYGK